ncbi:ubiquitin carboxyl-terminal hydrolase 10-B isoform X1 [Athalia rosae]|uniref:ubiquitin carboxyl-terminal hydrolase 10-B isoform X1 n=1 Tax=Athalia rosae TaxID=37344 RepID=UPI00203388B1|nr:ubiquitin carboxyl-terminal hydrolase 10-B isoform X1 [Athalia rosae]
MDIKYKNEYEFLDLSGLDDSTKVEINVALHSGTATEVLQLPWDTGELEYCEPEVLQSDPEVAANWQSDEPEQTQVTYTGEIGDVSAATIYQTMRAAHLYQQPHPPRQMMTTVCSGMYLTPPYEIGPEVSIHPYVPDMGYPQSMYIQGAEIPEVTNTRDNRRRHHRGRGNKRDTNNRYIEPSAEMAPSYIPTQGQYHRIPRNMCFQPIYYQTEHQNHPRQRSFHPPPAMYPPPISHPVYQPEVCQHPGSGTHNQYTRHTTPIAVPPRQRPEHPKNSVKRASEPPLKASTTAYGPPPLSIQRKPEVSNSPQPNIDCVVTTVILNNSKIEHSVNNETNECSASTKYSSNNNNNNINLNNSNSSVSSSNSNSTSSNSINNNNNNNNTNNQVPRPMNLTIEHNIVATVNKSNELSEKMDVPYVNINSSIQVKQKTENNVELRKETVTHLQTISPEIEPKVMPKTESKVIPKDKEEVKEKETVQPSIPETVEAVQEPDIAAPQSPVPPTPRAALESAVSWASVVLKKTSTETVSPGITNGKPTARINPLPVDSVTDSETLQKFPFSPSEAPGNRRHYAKKANHNTEAAGIDAAASSNRLQTKEESNSSNKFDDLDAYKIGEFLLNYQMEKQTVSLLPRGLINRSNYCYINSILQALLACPPFYNLLVALPYSKSAARNNASNNLTTNLIRFVHEFSPLSAGARLPRKDRAQKRSDEALVPIQSGIAFEPTYVYTMLKNTLCANVFSVEGRQEDAEEFLSCLLNGISDEMLEMMKLGNSENPPPATTIENESAQPIHGDQEEWKIMGPKNKGSITRCTEFGRTPLSDIFRGQLRYRVSRAGDQSTDNVQPFFTLQLDIEKAESVKGALEILVGKDQLEGMTCSKTKREIEAWKQVQLEELPVILILHLKWFDYKLDGCSKILKSVEFPIDLKIDAKILSANALKKLSLKQKQYKLFAVTYHDGKEATKGHYVTDAFHVGYGCWVRYDDSSLKGVPEHNVLNPQPPRVPYLLYYRRCDTIGNNQLNNDRIR